MVRLEILDRTHGARTTRRRRIARRMMMRRFSVGFNRADGFDAHICQGETAIEKCRVGSIIFLDSVHELG